MLPDPEDAPAKAAKLPCHQPVARLVRGEFLLPEGRVVLRLGSMERARVPETPVHEDGESVLGEDEVRLAKHSLVPPPAGDMLRTKDAY